MARFELESWGLQFGNQLSLTGRVAPSEKILLHDHIVSCRFFSFGRVCLKMWMMAHLAGDGACLPVFVLRLCISFDFLFGVSLVAWI